MRHNRKCIRTRKFSTVAGFRLWLDRFPEGVLHYTIDFINGQMMVKEYK